MQGQSACDGRAHRVGRAAGLNLLLRPLLTGSLRVPGRLGCSGPRDVGLLRPRGRGGRVRRGVQGVLRLSGLLVGARASGPGPPAGNTRGRLLGLAGIALRGGCRRLLPGRGVVGSVVGGLVEVLPPVLLLLTGDGWGGGREGLGVHVLVLQRPAGLGQVDVPLQPGLPFALDDRLLGLRVEP